MSGVFIVFEGPDGGGTTTHARLLEERLRVSGKEVVLTAEPTGGAHGRRIREVIEGRGVLQYAPTPEDLQRLFCADRAEHIASVIAPSLAEGKTVICDRYVPSTLVYGEVSGVPRELLEKWNADFPKPDLTILTLPPFATCLERLERRETRDSFEQEEFQRKVYEGYVRYAGEHSEVEVVDTSGAKEEVAERIWEAVSGEL